MTFYTTILRICILFPVLMAQCYSDDVMLKNWFVVPIIYTIYIVYLCYQYPQFMPDFQNLLVEISQTFSSWKNVFFSKVVNIYYFLHQHFNNF